jgi:predicted dienelactone hydrolase
MSVRRFAAGIVAFVIAAPVILVTALWIEHAQPVTLPAPTGSFPVGRTIREWSIGPQREVVAWMWYPAATGHAGETAEYLPPRWRSAIEQSRPAFVNRLLTRDLAKVRAHGLPDRPLGSRGAPYPVLILRAGGSNGVVHYSSLAEDLASHGYVVVGFDVPQRTNVVAFSDGRVIRGAPENNPEAGGGEERARRVDRLLNEWTADIGRVLDTLQERNSRDFAGRLDLTRVGVLGHSFGGAQAAEFCHRDPRCKAAVDIDGIPFGSVTREAIGRPIMFLLSDHSAENDPENARIMAAIQSISERAPASGRALVVIPGAHHFTFTDDGAILKSRLLRGILRTTGRLHIDGRRQLEITAEDVRTFFDRQLER